MIDDREFNDLLRKIKYDAEAREKFCFNYFNLLRTHVYSKYGEFYDWEDIVQDVINKLITTDWTNYPHINNPMAWLYTIADNHAKDLFKKLSRTCEFNDNSYSNFNIDYVDMRNDIRNALKMLKSEAQYIIYAHYWLGKGLYTIAKEINKSYVSVRVKIKRARNLLEKYFEKYL